MEAFVGVLMIVSVVIWVCVRFSDGRDGSAAQPRRGPPARPRGVPPQRVTPIPPSSPSSHDDAAFFDGYIWGRLQERHDERQHGSAEAHDHDMFDGDDCFDVD
jgi:hypothetical protein